MEKENFFKGLEDNKIRSHFCKIFKKETMFASYFRKDFNLLGVNTNNLVERSFLEIKDKFLERRKAFNPLDLLEKIINGYDASTRIKIIDFVNHRAPYVYKGLLCLNKHVLRKSCIHLLNNKKICAPTTIILKNLKSKKAPTTEQITDKNEVKLDREIFDEAINKIILLAENEPNWKILNKWSKKINSAGTNCRLIDILVNGITNQKKILKNQSRINSSSNKNRFRDLSIKPIGTKPRNLMENVEKNSRNKSTQEKK